MTEHEQTPAAGSAAHPDKPRQRLVIRAVILPDEPVPAPVESWSIPRLLVAVAVLVALALLGWFAFRSFTTPSAPPPQETTMPNSQPSWVAPMEPAPIAPEPAESVASTPSGTPSPVEEVIPTPSSNALQTIRGTIRVSLRLRINQQGSVTDVERVDAGPSRYFERLSIEAAKQWKFPPADGSSSVLLRFHFTREGVTARVDSE